MSKLTLAALVSGLALSLASPVFVQAAAPATPADADQPTRTPEPKKDRVAKPDTRSDKAKAAGSTPAKDADQPAGAPAPKKDRVAKPDTRSDKAKAAGSTLKDADQPAGAPESKPKNK